MRIESLISKCNIDDIKIDYRVKSILECKDDWEAKEIGEEKYEGGSYKVYDLCCKNNCDFIIFLIKRNEDTDPTKFLKNISKQIKLIQKHDIGARVLRIYYCSHEAVILLDKVKKKINTRKLPLFLNTHDDKSQFYKPLVNKRYSKDVIKSLEKYKGIYYDQINTFLRDSVIPSVISDNFLKQSKNHIVIKDIINIDSVMSTDGYDSLKTILLYRGVSAHHLQMIKEQGVIVNISYTSCSKDIDVSVGFSGNNGCCLLVFTMPENINFVDYENRKFGFTEEDDDEKEVLFQRNTMFDNFKHIGVHKGIKNKPNVNIYSCRLSIFELPELKKQDVKVDEIFKQSH